MFRLIHLLFLFLLKNFLSLLSYLHIQKDSWGNSGSNGGTVTLNMTNQKATGNIVVDSNVKSLTNADTINSNIHTNGCKLYVNGTQVK